MKVGFVINSLAGGGAERILGYVVNSIDRKRFSPFLCLLASPDIGYELAEDVPVCAVGNERLPFYLRALITFCSFFLALPAAFSLPRFQDVFRHFRMVLRQLARGARGVKNILESERPDALVVFLQPCIVITLLTLIICRVKIPVVCADRVFLSHELQGYRFPSLNRLLVKFLYKRIDVYLAVSEEIKRDMTENFGVPHSKIVTVYNGCDLNLLRQRASEPLSMTEEALFHNSCTVIITVGRLMDQKGHDDLLKAFALLRQTVCCKLVIVGEGSNLGELLALADDLGIAEDVAFPGWSDNPFKLVAAADVFVLSSHYEGFPNVLLEAIALGRPVVSTDCPTGPSEILDKGRFGVLVPPANPDALAEALQKVCGDRALRSKLQSLSEKRAEDFSLGQMVSAYELILENLPVMR